MIKATHLSVVEILFIGVVKSDVSGGPERTVIGSDRTGEFHLLLTSAPEQKEGATHRRILT